MAYKHKRLKDLRKLDPNATTEKRDDEGNTVLKPAVESTQYWNEVLRREGLSEDEGRDSGHRKMLYVGNSRNLSNIHEMQIRKATGLVRPEGHGPDKFVKSE